MTTSPIASSTPTSSPATLCPNCGGTSLSVTTSTTITYHVVFDHDTRELVVVSESVGDTDWDEQSLAACAACNWQGKLRDCF